MTEETPKEESKSSELTAAQEPSESIESISPAMETKTYGAPVLWPAVAVVIVHLAITFGVLLYGSTNLQNTVGLIGAPALALAALSLWWLSSRHVSQRDKVFGLGAILAAILIVFATHGAPEVFMMISATAIALPVLTTSVVAGLVALRNWPWSAQRKALLGVIAIVVIFFGFVRIDAIGGDLIPHMSFVWSPAPDNIALASPDEIVGGVATLPEKAGPQDWPAFRGPERSARVAGFRFATNWDEAPPKELWRRPIGLGWSSFTVVDGYAFTQEQRGEEEVVSCYDANTGEPVWLNAIPVRFDDSTGSGPRATPTFHEGRLYTQGANGLLQCLDASNGEAIWSRDVGDDTGASLPRWGFASSPLVQDENVIVFTGADNGKSVIAYKKDSGDIAWTSGNGDHAYSSAHLATVANELQVLITSNYGLQALDPKTGELAWEHVWPLKNYARITQPCLTEPNSMIIGSISLGSRSLRVRKAEGGVWDVDEEWTSRQFRPYFNDFVFFKGFCYGFDGDRLTCIDAATGYRRWRGERTGGQILGIDDMSMMLVLSEDGEVILLEATPNEPREVARFDAIKGKTWNHPVIAQGKLFVRNSQEAACFELTPQ